MADRITMARLKSRVSLLNDVFGFADSPYQEERDSSGGLIANAGTYVLDCAYGGYRLGQMCPGGGERDLSGRGTARETYDVVNAYIDGATAMKKHMG